MLYWYIEYVRLIICIVILIIFDAPVDVWSGLDTGKQMVIVQERWSGYKYTVLSGLHMRRSHGGWSSVPSWRRGLSVGANTQPVSLRYWRVCWDPTERWRPGMRTTLLDWIDFYTSRWKHSSPCKYTIDPLELYFNGFIWRGIEYVVTHTNPLTNGPYSLMKFTLISLYRRKFWFKLFRKRSLKPSEEYNNNMNNNNKTFFAPFLTLDVPTPPSPGHSFCS